MTDGQTDLTDGQANKTNNQTKADKKIDTRETVC